MVFPILAFLNGCLARARLDSSLVGTLPRVVGWRMWQWLVPLLGSALQDGGLLPAWLGERVGGCLAGFGVGCLVRAWLDCVIWACWWVARLCDMGVLVAVQCGLGSWRSCVGVARLRGYRRRWLSSVGLGRGCLVWRGSIVPVWAGCLVWALVVGCLVWVWFVGCVLWVGLARCLMTCIIV